MQNVVGPTFVAMSTKFGLGAGIQSPTGLSPSCRHYHAVYRIILIGDSLTDSTAVCERNLRNDFMQLVVTLVPVYAPLRVKLLMPGTVGQILDDIWKNRRTQILHFGLLKAA